MTLEMSLKKSRRKRSVPNSPLQNAAIKKFRLDGDVHRAHKISTVILDEALELSAVQRDKFKRMSFELKQFLLALVEARWERDKKLIPARPVKPPKTDRRSYDASKFKLVPIEEESTDGRTTRD